MKLTVVNLVNLSLKNFEAFMYVGCCARKITRRSIFWVEESKF